MDKSCTSARARRRLAVVLLALAVAAGATGGAAQPAAVPGRLTVERVASLPSLPGTAPSSPVWSPDAARLAFLWNDAGWPARVVWTVNPDGGG
jgi:dipeptidyl-peptidase-4